MARAAQARRVSKVDALDEAPTMERSRRAALRRNDKTMDTAYRHGQNNGRVAARARGARSLVSPGALPDAYPLDPSGENIEQHRAYQQGADDAISTERRQVARGVAGDARDRATKRVMPPLKEGSGFLLGLVAYALFLAYMRDGTAGPKNWLKAKFLNETPTKSQAPKPNLPPGTPGLQGPVQVAPGSPPRTLNMAARIPATTVAYVPLNRAGPG